MSHAVFAIEILKSTEAYKGRAVNAEGKRMDIDGEEDKEEDDLQPDVALEVRDTVWESAHSDFTRT